MVAITFRNQLDVAVEFTIDIPNRIDRTFKLKAQSTNKVSMDKYKKWNGLKVKIRVRGPDINGKFYQQIEPRKSKIVDMSYTIFNSGNGIRIETTTISNALDD